MRRAAQLLVDEPFDDEPEVPPEALTRRRTTPRRRAVARVAELLDESPIPPFFPILHKLYSRILASLQVAMDHLAEPETALQDLTTLHDQVHTRLQPPPHSTASSTTGCRQVPRPVPSSATPIVAQVDELGEIAKEVKLPPAHHLELDPVMDETDVEIVSASVAETREQLLALISYLVHPALVDADAPAAEAPPSPHGRRAPPALRKRRSALDRLEHHEPGDIVPAAFVRHPLPWYEVDTREPLRRELLARYADVRTFVERKRAELTRQVRRKSWKAWREYEHLV